MKKALALGARALDDHVTFVAIFQVNLARLN